MPVNIAVIGGGVFGSVVAAKLAEAGRHVTLFERMPQLLSGASNNANRLHLGYHYPRDEETARQCMLGYDAFRAAFPGTELEGVSNTYFIARHGSLVTADEYLSFCERMGLPYRLLELGKLGTCIDNVAIGIQTEEAIFDAPALRRLLMHRLLDLGVETRCNSDIVDIDRKASTYRLRTESNESFEFDGAVNCSYVDIASLTERLGYDLPSCQYEYTAVPVVEIEFHATESMTVLDGPFVSLLPFGGRNHYLMYHVDHSVIARSDGERIERAWLNRATSPFASVYRRLWFERHVEACAFFIPALRGALLKGVAEGPRIVLKNREQTDARPSFITRHEPGYISVFAGKVDHSIWIADAVREALA